MGSLDHEVSLNSVKKDTNVPLNVLAAVGDLDTSPHMPKWVEIEQSRQEKTWVRRYRGVAMHIQGTEHCCLR